MEKRHFHLLLLALALIVVVFRFDLHHRFLNDNATVQDTYGEHDQAAPDLIAYQQELETAAGVPDWYSQIDLPQDLIQPKNHEDVNWLITSILTAPCCQASDVGADKKLKTNAKAMYQVALDNFRNPQVASYAIYNLLKKNRTKGWSNQDLAQFYLKHFYYTDVENQCRNCLPANYVWEVIQLHAKNQHVRQRDPEAAFATVREFIDKRGYELAIHHRFEAALEMARFLDFSGKRPKAAQFIANYLGELDSQELNDGYYSLFNELLDACAIYDSSACADHQKKSRPAAQPEHDPNLQPSVQVE